MAAGLARVRHPDVGPGCQVWHIGRSFPCIIRPCLDSAVSLFTAASSPRLYLLCLSESLGEKFSHVRLREVTLARGLAFISLLVPFKKKKISEVFPPSTDELEASLDAFGIFIFVCGGFFGEAEEDLDEGFVLFPLSLSLRMRNWP